MTEYTPPTQDEIDRVAAYWQRVKLLTCDHAADLMFDSSTVGPRCSKCDQPLRFLSDTQVENLRLRPPLNPDVRDRIIQQLDRGGVRFATDGEWYEFRLHAHQDGTCVEVSDVIRLLRATEA